ncbi:MAG: SRPBCC family protein [Actinomycetota bacterium]|jgi:carbon monoxide dehydrogenase subunit G|nr:SRPBCC family protein [Actinomycetota bacterium]
MTGISVEIFKKIAAPQTRVASFIEDFRNAKDWMVGVEDIEQTGDEEYRLTIESPVGRLEPEARIVEHRPGYISWRYTSTVEGEGKVEVVADKNGEAVVKYTGEFTVKGAILSRAAKAVGMEGFARRQGERSLDRLKHLMEARR